MSKLAFTVSDSGMGVIFDINDRLWESEEYQCAMRVLDEIGVPRDDGNRVYSLVGRIKHLAEKAESQS